VVWGWTRGLLPYRDVFDNHSPLFQALYAPLFYLFGVRADILLPMRAAELPLFALTIYAVWKIAGALYSARTALWTAVLTALLPWFYLSAIEFRPDQLWALLWLLLLMVLTTGRITPRRVWLAGLLCGAAFSVSMKTTLLLMALAPSLIGALLVRRAAGGLALRWSHLWRCAAVGLTGIPIIPGIVVLFFYLKGAASEMYYGIIQHNILPGSTSHGLSNGTIKCCLLGLGVSIAGGFLISRLRQPIHTRTRIAFVYFAGIFYLTALFGFWPLQPAEDFLPFFPTMMLTVGPAALWLACFATRTPRFTGPLLAGVETIAILIMASPFQDQTADKIGMVADTLKLTAPDEYVMDSKGETIYRRRPFRYVMESLTFHRMKMKLIEDDIPDQLIRTRAPLAASTFRMPHKGREFIKGNYVPIAFRLRALGQVLRGNGRPSRGPYSFQVAVPQRYTLVTPDGPAVGTLDGSPFTGPRELAAGSHLFVPEGHSDRLVLIWATAVERGYSPFVKLKDDQTTAQD
jgi:hypothetical protein